MTKEIKRVAMVLLEDQEYSLRLLEGAIRYAGQHPHIQLVEFEHSLDHDPAWLDKPLGCDGLLLWVQPVQRWGKRLMRMGLPAVNTAPGWPSSLAPSVTFSLEEMVRAALDHLSGLGRERIALVQYDVGISPPDQAWRRLFLQLAAKRGLRAEALDVGRQPGMDRVPPRLTARGQQRLRAFLRRSPRPAAAWGNTDHMAQMTLEAARALGLEVPGQLAVLGVGDYRMARYCRPSLSSVPLPGDVIGFEALHVLDAMMAGRPPAPRKIKISPPPIVVRESSQVSAPTHDAVEQAHQFIVEQACQGITVDDVLRLVPMSLPTLHKQFMSHYGRTPGAEIRRVKTERAQHYLRTTTLSVMRVAELCGYDQHAKFSNFFKRETGRTPSEYRKRSR